MDERLSRILNDPKTIPAAVGLVSFGVGAGLGYILGKRRRVVVVEAIEIEPDEKYEVEGSGIDEEDWAKVREVKDIQLHSVHLDPHSDLGNVEVITVANEGKNEVKPVADLIRLKEDKNEEILVEQVTVDKLVEDEPVVVTKSVFAEEGNDWNLEEELASRSDREPYIIHKDEFFDNETDYAQMALTYYVGDLLMADEEDSIVYSPEQILGSLRFGHGSGDPNVVYIRNDRLRTDYEVTRHRGHYAVEVQGLEIENAASARDLRHSAPRFRQE